MLAHRFRVCKSLAGLWPQTAKNTFRAFSTAAIIEDDSEHFKAAVLHPGKQSLAIETMADRTKLDDGMVRIGIEYCSLTNADIRCMTDLTDVTLPYIPGSEFGGKVLEVSDNCSHSLKPGDNVAVFSDEIHVGGGLSQQCIVNASICIPLDEKISVQNAVTTLQAYGNAQLAFTKYSPLKEGDDIVVIAGPGGNGLAAIEVARKIYKANVFVIFDSTSVTALLRDDVAYRACNAQAGLTKVYQFLDGALKKKKAKMVYDTTGSGILHVVSDFVEPGGRYLTDDRHFNAETYVRPYFKRLESKQKNKKSDAKTTKQDAKTEAKTEAKSAPISTEWLQQVRIVSLAKYVNEPLTFDKIINDVIAMLSEAKIEPFISATYPLGDVNKAIRFIQRKKCLGKILVDTSLIKAKRT